MLLCRQFLSQRLPNGDRGAHLSFLPYIPRGSVRALRTPVELPRSIHSQTTHATNSPPRPRPHCSGPQPDAQPPSFQGSHVETAMLRPLVPPHKHSGWQMGAHWRERSADTTSHAEVPLDQSVAGRTRNTTCGHYTLRFARGPLRRTVSHRDSGTVIPTWRV